MTLLLVALLSLAQLVQSAAIELEDGRLALWETLCVFFYSAVILNLTCAFLSLVIIKMCDDLLLAYYQKSYRRATWTTHDAEETPALPREVENWSRQGILRQAGMYRPYRLVNAARTCILLVAFASTFVSFTLWVVITAPNDPILWVTMVIFGIAALVAVGSYLVAAMGEGWT